jgi:hypothetical protein
MRQLCDAFLRQGLISMRIALALVPLLLMAGCATPSQRIATKLTQYGVPPAQAQCMGDRLASRLTRAQLQRLADIAQMDPDRVGKMSINEIAQTLGESGDPAIVSEVIKTGLVCLA